MRPSSHGISVALALAAACSVPPEASREVARGPAEPTRVVFQAVDAGTGSALRDPELTVRYLVRSPITLDVAEVERVPTLEPYAIEHEVTEDALVVEVRLEAASYHRLDTALSVPKGGAVGPLTLRMSRKLGQLAESERPPPVTAPSTPPAGTAGSTPAGTGGVAVSRPVPAPEVVAMQAGDRAFQRGDWLAAIQAYARLPAPENEASRYGRQYQQALVRRGVAHINRGEFGSALEVLEDAARFDSPGYDTHLRLSQAQCAVGSSAEGRGTLAVLGRGLGRMPAGDRPLVSALIQYQRGVCSHGDFDRAQTTRDRVRMGAAAIGELQDFIAEAERISSAPRQLEAAVADARRRIDLVRGQVAGRS
jgi:hypothetical protein